MRYAFALFVAAISPLGAEPLYYKDVLPVLQQHCQSCHRKGEIGPMPLLTYEEVRPWAKAIRQSVTLRRMPPWFADPHFEQFANDPSLSSDEIKTIQNWVDSGAHAGSKTDAPPAVHWPDGGALANPTLETAMPEPFRIPAKATVPYQSFVLPASFTADTWVTEVEIRPSDRSIVHHAVLYVREPGETWTGKVPVTADILAVYTPGTPVMRAPEGMAKRIPAGSSLILQMHYTAKKVDAKDRTRIAMTAQSERPRYRLLTLQMMKPDLRIPPGERECRLSVSGTLAHDALLVSMLPHMHLRGTGFEYQIAGGQGRLETLLKINNYDFNWQLDYQLKTPRLLPAGTRLLFTGYYDNSAANPRNPDPTAEVTWGEQSWEEMLVGFFDVAVPPDTDKGAYIVGR